MSIISLDGMENAMPAGCNCANCRAYARNNGSWSSEASSYAGPCLNESRPVPPASGSATVTTVTTTTTVTVTQGGGRGAVERPGQTRR
ncbi:hypothetical protein A2348_01305 [Candidatus Uhrbacteria bacterium RIFOXYB12_FULL_58_10]|uniref:Uncharacterized protein n=1 Tax=Candidatus Uhrbacteria bacterium RIFOXYB2_FULL_57_15 TaxID=1802422 RepID=A0A1F7WAF0_9BACT|nr:MAG: hypothetical protein A2348_01305 [Candidatus Uhrbacteria bacterium RIFOXYB12_FULL_58_10]OGL99054.1 MAG: hypothetical protein A2304_02820 [Candidatus Uhrbacteria bacterium RIFOXYB2_FULL_57_15]